MSNQTMNGMPSDAERPGFFPGVRDIYNCKYSVKTPATGVLPGHVRDLSMLVVVSDKEEALELLRLMHPGGHVLASSIDLLGRCAVRVNPHDITDIQTRSVLNLLEVLKETQFHIVELYHIAGEGTCVMAGLNQALGHAAALQEQLLETIRQNPTPTGDLT